MKNFSCPLCNAKQTKFLTTLNSIVSIKGKMKEWKMTHRICESCGVIMFHPSPKLSELNNYYENAYPFQYELKEQRQLPAFKFIRKITKTKGNVFDIGPGDAYLLSLFKKSGYTCYGSEPNKELVLQVREKYGINLLVGDFETNFKKINQTKYDLFCMSHVLEHLYEPKKVLKKIRSILKPNGLLYIEVPSLELFSNHNLNSELTAFTHLWHFSKISLTNLIENMGFKTIKIETSLENDFPVIRAIFKKSTKIIKPKLSNPEIKKISKYFDKYLQRRDSKTANAFTIISKFLLNNNVVFYGAGQDLFDLMIRQSNIFSSKNYFIVDSNPDKWGEKLHGVEIFEPKLILSLDNPVILVTSRLFTIQDSMIKSIKQIKKNLKIVKIFK